MAVHRSSALKGFTSSYVVKRLVWYESHPDMESATRREKQLKKWNRGWKLALTERTNPKWWDLSESWL